MIAAALALAVAIGAFGAAPPAGAATPGSPGGGNASGPRAGGPTLDANAWILIDARTGDVLASHAARRHLSIASTTKLMTAYLALKKLPLDKRIKEAPYEAIPAESLLGVPAGTVISVRDLLYGLILRSGNDAAYTLAVATAGTEAKFVREMNLRAAALGLADTHYSNPIGLDEPGNYSSAADLATLTQRLLAIPAFARIADTEDTELDSLRSPFAITTRNTLLERAPYATGVKTGHTLTAGYVLVGSAQRNGTKLISAVLGAPSETDRDLESLELLNYGFSLYSRNTAVRKGKVYATPEIKYSGGDVALRALRGVSLGIRRGQKLDVKVDAPSEVTGPVPRGTRLGTVSVFLDGRKAQVVPLVSARAVPEASRLDRVKSFVSGHAIALAIAAFAILLLLLMLRRLWRRLRNREGGGSKSMRDEMRAEREQRRTDREMRRRNRVEGEDQ